MEERKPTSIRFPRSLRVWIKGQALKNDRSISSEVVSMIREIKDVMEKKELKENVGA